MTNVEQISTSPSPQYLAYTGARWPVLTQSASPLLLLDDPSISSVKMEPTGKSCRRCISFALCGLSNGLDPWVLAYTLDLPSVTGARKAWDLGCSPWRHPRIEITYCPPVQSLSWRRSLQVPPLVKQQIVTAFFGSSKFGSDSCWDARTGLHTLVSLRPG